MMGPNRLGGQVAIAFGLKIWNAGASFVMSLMIARAFGAQGSGYFGMTVTTVAILSTSVLLGLDYITIRVVAGDMREGKKAEARGAVRAVVQTMLVVAPVVAGVVWLMRDWLSISILAQPQVADLLGIMLWAIVPLALQRIAAAALRACGHVIASQFVDGVIGTTVACFGIGLLLLFHGAHTMTMPGWLYVFGLGTGATVGWYLYRRAVREWPAAQKVDWRPLVIAGLPILLLNLSNVFTEWYTTISLARHWTAADVGQYRVAWQFVALAGLVQVAMDTMIGPRIAAAARVGAKYEIVQVARKSILLVLLLGAPLFLVLLVFPEQLLSIFGPQFRHAALALQILALGQLFRLVCGPLGSIIVMTGSQKWAVTYTITGVILCIVIVAMLVPTYGVVGAAWATAGTVVARNLIGALIVRYALGIDLFSRGG